MANIKVIDWNGGTKVSEGTVTEDAVNKAKVDNLASARTKLKNVVSLTDDEVDAIFGLNK
tara:strand:- start:525 stop:704 length:180 start_codon:yes stop_codon:yes gene_type:complete